MIKRLNWKTAPKATFDISEAIKGPLTPRGPKPVTKKISPKK